MNPYPTPKQLHSFSLPAVAAIALLLVVLFTQQARGDSSPDNPMPSGPTPVDMQTFATNVAKTDAAEQADQQRMVSAQQTVLAGTPFDKSSQILPTVPPQPVQGAPETGITGRPILPPGWSQMYSISNAWSQIINGNFIIACAGSKADNPGGGVWDAGIQQQGMVKIDAYSSNGTGPRVDSLVGDYLTPTRTGPVQITAYNGTCLTLLSTNNTTYQFDVATRQWSCSVNQQPPP